MELLHILGYIGALLTGLVLGLLGGGGALLSVPVLKYMFHIEPTVATSYSLFLIAVTATSGAYQNIRKKQIDYNAALYYGIPSVISVLLIRILVMPNLPKIIFTAGNYAVDKDLFVMIVLVTIMFIAAYKMITSSDVAEERTEHETNHIQLMLFASAIGALMALVGAGGGFLMVPALIYFANTPTKKAIGTSLLLVSVNSFLGFGGDVIAGLVNHKNAPLKIDWPFFFTFLFFSIAGVFIGHYLANHIHNSKLKRYFGYFLLIAALGIIAKEFLLH